MVDLGPSFSVQPGSCQWDRKYRISKEKFKVSLDIVVGRHKYIDGALRVA